jgi:hypothetical protein
LPVGDCLVEASAELGEVEWHDADSQNVALPLLRLLEDGQAHRLSELTERIAQQFRPHRD